MRRFSSPMLLFSLLKSYLSEAHPAPQADAAPCSTIVNLPKTTLTIIPGPSNTIVNGFPNGATSTIEANGPAITIGPDILSINEENNVDLNGNVFLFPDGFCPAFVIPITSLPPSSRESTAVTPVVPAPTDTPDDDSDDTPTNSVPGPDPSPTEAPDTPSDDPEDPDDDPEDSDDDPSPPVLPIPLPPPGLPIPVPNPNPNPVDPVPDPVDPVDPTITPPPQPPTNEDPSDEDPDEDPSECETQTVSVCTRGCSFGTNSLGVTTTTSCKDPTCTARTACSASDTTSTTTIEPPGCSIGFNGVAPGYPFAVDGNGPLPRFKDEPAPADPQPTSEPPRSSSPSRSSTSPPKSSSPPRPAPTDDPVARPDPPKEPKLAPTQVYRAGSLTKPDGREFRAVFGNAPDSPLDMCNDNAFYLETTSTRNPGQLGDFGIFDLPDSYTGCVFKNDGIYPFGIYCEGQDRVPCRDADKETQIKFCLTDDSPVFSVTWVCNE